MRQDGTSEPRAVATRLNSEPELRFLRSETGGAAQTNAHASSVFTSDASSGLVNTPKQTSALPVSVLYQHKRVVLVQGDSGGFVRQLKRRWVTPEHHPQRSGGQNRLTELPSPRPSVADLRINYICLC